MEVNEDLIVAIDLYQELTQRGMILAVYPEIDGFHFVTEPSPPLEFRGIITACMPILVAIIMNESVH